MRHSWPGTWQSLGDLHCTVGVSCFSLLHNVVAESMLDPSSSKPLFPLIITALNDGDCIEQNSDPCFYVGSSTASSGTSASGTIETNDDDTSIALTKFWMQAHTFSCFKRSSFQISAEQTYNDSMHGLFDGGIGGEEEAYKHELHLDFVRNIMGGGNVCAYIAKDGTIINNNTGANEKKHRCYRMAYCLQGSSRITDPQIEMVARLSGQILIDGHGSQHSVIGNVNEELISQRADANAPAATAARGGWFGYLKKGATYAIDKALAVYDGDDDYSAPVGSLGTSSGVELDDALLQTSDDTTTMIDQDDNTIARGKATATTLVLTDDTTLGNADPLINIDIVVSTCRQLLEYSSQQIQTLSACDVNEEAEIQDMFSIGGHHHHGDVERVMLYRNGWGACTLGSFCRQAGNYLARDDQQQKNNNNDVVAESKRISYGKILSGISEMGVDILAITLCKSNYALIENDIITLFPGGISSTFEQTARQSDHALFQIHVTKLAIQGRMARLEQDVKVAKQSAVKAQRKKMTQLALVHMRRKKAGMEELERCASILANLDASELRLERARNDVQIVQSYTVLKTALQDIRETNEGVENVEELMMDIREEMEEVNAIEEVMYPEVIIDEDELNEEFKRLEMECESEQLLEATATDDAATQVEKVQSDKDLAEKVADKAVVDEKIKSEVVAA